MKNKKYSLQVNRIIAEIKKICHENENLVRLQKDEDKKVLLHIEDIDSKSDFYFKVNQVPVEKRSRYTMIDFKPSSDISVENDSYWSSGKKNLYIDTIRAFKSWVQMLKKYDEAYDTDESWIQMLKEYNKSDAPIPEVRSEDFTNKEYLDKRSKLQLGIPLTYLIGKLEMEKNESNKEEISPIIEEVKNLNKSLFQISKDAVKSELKNIFDKIEKYSPPFLESVFKGFKVLLKN